MKALVISGGGSKGAFAGGVAEFLINECHQKYDIIAGTSTGSLMIPMIAIGEIDRLKRVYTAITEKDVFTGCPFKISTRNGTTETRINYFRGLSQLIKGAKTFGSSDALRKVITETYTPKDFQKIKESNVELIATVSNISMGTVEYKNLKECSYDDFCDWIWISANMIPFMSLVSKNGYEYADGGIGNRIPIQEVIKRGATDVDVIVLSPAVQTFQNHPTRNVFSLIMRVFDFMLSQNSANDITIGQLEQNLNHEVDIHFYHTPYHLTDNFLEFNPEKMKMWWELGFNYAKKNDPEFCRLKRRK